MKIILWLAAVLSFSGLITSHVENLTTTNKPQEISVATQIPKAKGKIPVLVELYTSEGCYNCPPADKNLGFLEREQPNPEAEIITLALHVDYYNRLGWTDRFSSPVYVQRQAIYGTKFKVSSIYTPQMVVDGTKQFVGNNLKEAQKAISESAKLQKAKVELSNEEDKLKIKISEMPAHENATVFIAIAEDNLASNVSRGENSGKTLQHTSIVRELKPIASLSSSENSFEGESVLQFQPDWKRENLKIIVFVQENQSRKIFGVGRFLLDKRQ